MTIRQTRESNDPDTLSSPPDPGTWLDEHGDALFRFARTRVGNRELAEDLVQETFLAALQSWDRFEGRSTTRTWLLSILRRKIIDHYRRINDSLAPNSSDSIPDSDTVRARNFSPDGFWSKALLSWSTPDKALEDREFWDVFDRCLSRLPAAFSSVFVLRELEGLEMTELSDSLNLTEGNLRVRLHRARLMLRECLEKHWFAEAPTASRRST